VSTVTNWDEYPGHLEAVEMVEVRPKVAGYIESIHFDDGAEVKAGDLLFVIDPKPFEAELQRTQAERLRAETRADLARNDLKRAESLRGTKAISDEEFDTRSKAVREADAALAAARAAEASAQLNLDYCRVKAPIAGRIGRRLVTPGNLVQGGGMMPGTLLATLVSVDPVYCSFDADELAFNRYRLRRIAEGEKLAPIPCELELVGETGFPHRGQIDFFDNQVDARTGTVRVRGTFANPDRALIPGMFARVRVLAGPPEEALLIPEAAIASEQTRKFVYVVNVGEVVEPRPLQLGRAHGVERVVLSGLKPDDRVVVSGLLMLRPGIKVHVVDPNAPAGQGGPQAAPARG
jgi:multidrug efflux system membrane fusion protein